LREAAAIRTLDCHQASRELACAKAISRRSPKVTAASLTTESKMSFQINGGH
jgi:hypothetical protein